MAPCLMKTRNLDPRGLIGHAMHDGQEVVLVADEVDLVRLDVDHSALPFVPAWIVDHAFGSVGDADLGADRGGQTEEGGQCDGRSSRGSMSRHPDVKVLLTLDGSNFPLGVKNTLSGGDIPVAWINTKYRMVYVNYGYGDRVYSAPPLATMIDNILRWLLSR
jgi:hypothetical protein